MRKPLGILITDTHYSNNNVDEVNNVLVQCLQLALQLGVKKIYHGGDIFTLRTGQSLTVLLAFYNFLSLLSEYGIDMEAIPGNHDKTDLDSEDSYLDVFSNHPNFKVIRDGQIIKLGAFSLSLLPYFKERGTFPDRLKDLSAKALKMPAEKRYLLTHISVNGVKNNDGSKVADGVSTGMFNTWDKVFVGHYHNASVVGDNIYYIGSSHPQRYGENSDKGFTVLYNDGSHELVKADFKKYIKVAIDVEKMTKIQIERFRTKYTNPKHNIRFVFKGTEEKLKSVNEKLFTDVGIDIRKESDNILKSMTAAENDEFLSFSKASLMKEFVEYCKVNKVTGGDLSLGLKYMKQI